MPDVPLPQGPSIEEVLREYRRTPDQIPASEDPSEEFLRLACLRYGDDDGPEHWTAARHLLAGDPALPRTNIHVAAATCDVTAVRQLLARDPGSASRQGGPFGWEPLLYLTYARHDPELAEEAVLATARLLLDHGADPNAGYLWHGLTPPFTALTGVFGAGESSTSHQPEHPHAIALASLLLRAGADPNDGQTLYNRQFDEDDRHLELLLPHGLGRGDGGPWRARLGDAADSPAELVRRLLWWAVVHDQRHRVRLLTEHGADVTTPYRAHCRLDPFDGYPPCEIAALNGQKSIVDYLVAHGAAVPELRGADALVAAALSGDRAEVDSLSAHAEQARAARPGLIVWAAAGGKRDAIGLLAELGFDVNALGRADCPIEEPWETALHYAASAGDVDLARLLLSLGADQDIQDARFNATPLGWAHHFDQRAVADLLTPP